MCKFLSRPFEDNFHRVFSALCFKFENFSSATILYFGYIMHCNCQNFGINTVLWVIVKFMESLSASAQQSFAKAQQWGGKTGWMRQTRLSRNGRETTLHGQGNVIFKIQQN